MREPEQSCLERELAIAAQASRKLSVALSLAWAYLREEREAASKGITRRRESEAEVKIGAGPQGPCISDLQKELFE